MRISCWQEGFGEGKSKNEEWELLFVVAWLFTTARTRTPTTWTLLVFGGDKTIDVTFCTRDSR
jgi:hypothetical protein